MPGGNGWMFDLEIVRRAAAQLIDTKLQLDHLFGEPIGFSD